MKSKPKAILYDMVRCSGCKQCVKACMQIHDFKGDPEQVTDLSATAYTCMVQEKDYPLRNMCRHCLDPSCASVCPVAAIEKTPEGPVVWDDARCIGCRYCMVACPFNIPRYEWSSRVPCVRKCDMCYARVKEGKLPACAEACPQEATVFGEREELVRLAWERIRAEPDQYLGHLYGEREIGGTSVLFLAPFPVERLGFKKILGENPLPKLTRDVLSKIPAVLIVGGASLMGIWWITRRRDEVALAEGSPGRAQGHNGGGRNNGHS